MPPPALFLSPEKPELGTGGGGMRSACLLEYLRRRYDVTVASFTLRHHSRGAPARAWRNVRRLLAGRPPLFDRYSGYENQLPLQKRYEIAVIEHFWCAEYVTALRSQCGRVVLDLHNVESALARTHAAAARWPESWMFERFTRMYERLEREWLPQFDAVLVTSHEDRARIHHPNAIVIPNAIPEIPLPDVPQRDCIVFSGNLEYHPNVEAVRWFHESVWPGLRADIGEWRLVGRNAEAVAPMLAGDAQIHLTGPVEDAIVEIAPARVVVVPLLSGSGTRFKILEAWAAGRAVVSTSIGAEGLGAIDGQHLLIADDAASFATAVRRAWSDASLRRTLGEQGRALYLDRYTWAAAWRALDQASGGSGGGRLFRSP